MSIERKFSAGDAIVVEGTKQDGKAGTIIKCIHDEYLVTLEDGTMVFLTEENLSFRREGLQNSSSDARGS